MKNLSQRLLPHAKPSIFQDVQKWIRQHKALDIASGYPNWKSPQFLKESLINTLQQNEDQYGPPGGQTKLKAKIADYYQNQFKHTELGVKNVYIGLGAGGILNDLAQAFINPGDEVVLFDPHFPHHYTCPSIYGADVKSVPLLQPEEKEGTWKVDFDLLEKTINEKTRMLWLCSPHNPTGKVFTVEEYEKIAQILQKYPNIIIVSDEVYEFLYYDKKPVNRIANISDDIARRTITIGSYGKIFSATGWRVGYAICDPEYIKGMVLATQNGGYCVFRPGQIAMLDCIDRLNQPYKNDLTYLEYTNSKFQQNRDYIQSEFSQISHIDWDILKTEGGYFTMIDAKNHIPNIPLKYFYKNSYQNEPEVPCNKQYSELENPSYPADVAFVRYLLEQYQVSVLPTSSFYLQPQMENSLVRVSLAKTPDVFEQAVTQLKKQ